MSEAALWNWVKKYLPPGRYSRIESSTSPGIPDVSYTIQGARGWIELKDARKPTAKYPFKSGGLRPEQLNWFREELIAKGSNRLYILARVGRRICVIQGGWYSKFNGLTLDELIAYSVFSCTMTQLRSKEYLKTLHHVLESNYL